MLLRVSEPEERGIVEQLLRAHEYWRIKGLAVDLLILNEKELSYVEDFQSLLEGLVRESQDRAAGQDYGNQGGLFVLQIGQLSLEERRLLQTAARAMLVGNRGTLAEQLLRHPKSPSAFIATQALSVAPAEIPPLSCQSWNSLMVWGALPKTAVSMSSCWIRGSGHQRPGLM